MQTEENLIVKTRTFWKFVNRKREGRIESETKVFDGQINQDPNEIAKKFAEHFSSVYEIDESTTAELNDSEVSG